MALVILCNNTSELLPNRITNVSEKFQKKTGPCYKGAWPGFEGDILYLSF